MEPPRRPKVSPLFAGPRPNPKPRGSESAAHGRRIDHSRLKPAKPQPSGSSSRGAAAAAVETLLPGDSLGLSGVLLGRRRSRPSSLDGPQLGDALWDSVGTPLGSNGGSEILNWPASSSADSLDGGSVRDGPWGSSGDPLWESLQDESGLNDFTTTDENAIASFTSPSAYGIVHAASRVPGAALNKPTMTKSFRQKKSAKYAERPTEVATAAAESHATSRAPERVQDRRLDSAIRRVNSMARSSYRHDSSDALPLGSATPVGSSGLSKSLPQSLRFADEALSPSFAPLDVDAMSTYRKEDDPRNSSAALDALCASVVQKAADALAHKVEQHASRKAAAAAAADPMAAQGRVRRALKSSKVAAKAHAAAEQAEAADRAAKRAHALSLARAIGGTSSHSKRSDSSASSSRADSRAESSNSSRATSAAASMAALRSGLGTPPALPSSLPPLEGGHRHSSLPSPNLNNNNNNNSNVPAASTNCDALRRSSSRSGSRLGAQPEQATAAAQGGELAPGPQMSPVAGVKLHVARFPTEAWGEDGGSNGGAGSNDNTAGEQPASRSPSQSPPLEESAISHEDYTSEQPDRWAEASTTLTGAHDNSEDGGGIGDGMNVINARESSHRHSAPGRSRSPPLPPGITGIGGRGVHRLTSPNPASPIYPDSWPRGRPPGVNAGPPELSPWEPPKFKPRDPLSPRDQAESAALEVGEE
jgi:hypothetical protein